LNKPSSRKYVCEIGNVTLAFPSPQFIEKDEMQVDAEPFPTVIEYAEFDDALPQLLNGSKGLIASIKFMSGLFYCDDLSFVTVHPAPVIVKLTLNVALPHP
jgi:hypothetical protein